MQSAFGVACRMQVPLRPGGGFGREFDQVDLGAAQDAADVVNEEDASGCVGRHDRGGLRLGRPGWKLWVGETSKPWTRVGTLSRSKVAEPSRLCWFGLQQHCFCGETPQPPWWFMERARPEEHARKPLARPFEGT